MPRRSGSLTLAVQSAWGPGRAYAVGSLVPPDTPDPDSRSWLLAPGSWLLAPGSWLLAPGSWLLAPARYHQAVEHLGAPGGSTHGHQHRRLASPRDAPPAARRLRLRRWR